MKELIRLIRPEQWLKNLFVLTPLFFSGQMADTPYFMEAMVSMAVFCLAASGIYCLNDVMDAESDRRHPQKRHRPVASGKIGRHTAICIGFILTLSAIGTAWLAIGFNLAEVMTIYIILNVTYCLWLKQVALVDVFVISIGFVLRLIAGSTATGIILSHWIVLMTFLLALFLALAKRRDDVLIYERGGGQMRRNVNRYNLSFIDTTIAITVAITLVCYFMYTLSAEVITRTGSSHLYLTALFVLLGMFRYLQLTIVDARSGSPTRILICDHFLQMCIFGWIISFVLILYF